MKYLIIAGIVIVAVFLVLLSMIPLGIEPLTEVYIENHTSLPVNVFLNKSYNFSFSVHNLEYQKMGYEYTIKTYDVNDSLLFEIGKGSFNLLNNESETIDSSYKFNESFGRAKIEIAVSKIKLETPEFEKKWWWKDPNYPNEIGVHFWVDEIVPMKIVITA